MAEKSHFEVVVIGAGPGGYAAAFMAADLGKRVCIIDPRENPGGVCLYEGCIPSKALLHTSALLLEAGLAADWGINFGKPSVDIEKLRAWKNGVVGKLTGGLAFLGKKKKITYLRSRARFLDPHTVEVEERETVRAQTITFDNAIVATGSIPVSPPGFEADGTTVLDSTSALELREVPKRLLVVGGGYIGLEIGTIYAALGSRVSVVELLPRLLGGVDEALFGVYLKASKNLFDSIRVSTKATIEKRAGKIRASFQPQNGSNEEEEFDAALVAVGRKPFHDGLGLENTGVEIDKKGFVVVDPQRRTREASIFAIGDVAGGPLLAHKATHEGRVAAQVIAGRRVAYEPQVIPSVVYTRPEIAWCGLTEEKAREENREVAVARFPWGASGRAATMGESSGLTSLVIDPKSERVLGAGIVGSGAGELIAETALAIEMGAVASDLALTVHPHPSLSETIMEAAEGFYGESTHATVPVRKLP